MKTMILAAMLILGLAAIVPAQKEQTITLRPGQHKKAGHNDIKVKFVSVVEDSRCPPESACVWAGNAKVEVIISNRRGSKRVTMNTTTGNKGDQYGGWAINLVELTPKKNGKILQSNYKATFSISRLTR